MSYVPWLSQQLAAPDAPMVWLMPWMLVAYSLAVVSWLAWV